MAKAAPSILNAGLSGSAGPVTFVRRREGGTFIRQRDTPTDPSTNRQLETRQAMRRANHSFSLLTPAEMAAWKLYAARLADLAWAERQPRQVNPLNAYRTLALKWIQLNGFAEPPRTPPVTPFGGDGILVTAAPSESRKDGQDCKDSEDCYFGKENLSQGPLREGSSPSSQPLPRASLAGGASLTFTSSGPNSPGVVTELLLQPLRIAVSTPEPLKHRHSVFVAFTSDHLSQSVPAPRGWLSPAVRFVLSSTGQSSGLLLLEPVFV